MTTQAANSGAHLMTIAPQFVVPDVVAAAEYYRDVLGFQIQGYFWEPPVYSIVRRDSVGIHFGKADSHAGAAAAPNTPHREGSIDAYIWVDDVDVLFNELKTRGANIVEPPTARVYKCYEMVVEDKFGFRLAFGMDLPEDRRSEHGRSVTEVKPITTVS